jgi:DNA segregation ATPase FtsK/SpoIIIE, S-DNA-T family
MLTGQVPADFEAAAEGLAHATGCRSARVRVVSPGRLVIELAHADPLAAPTPALSAPATVSLDGVPIGICEDGCPWRLRVLGSHVLVAGVTRSGKGSVLWSLVAGLGPAIRSGVVSVWAVDPKGGMELGPGRALFARFAAEDFEQIAGLFDEAVALMRDRARRLAGVTRLHEPTSEEPLVLVVVDELASLTAYLPDRKLRERITQSLSLLLTQGRAVGVTVVAALQDPRKDVVTFRNLFPARVALRLDERTHVDMVLGDGSRAMGAYADRIPDTQPGVGYVRIDGVREPVRVRAAYVTDADIARLAATYRAPTASQDSESSAA